MKQLEDERTVYRKNRDVMAADIAILKLKIKKAEDQGFKIDDDLLIENFVKDKMK